MKEKWFFRPVAWALALLLPLSFALQKLAFALPAFAALYSEKVYPLLAKPVSALFSVFPFSFAEVMLFSCPVWLAALFWLFWKKIKKITPKPWPRAGLGALYLTGLVGVFFLGYMLFCGLNYARPGYETVAGYDASPMSVSELTALCEQLASEASAAREGLPEDEDGVFLPDELSAIAARTNENYQIAAQEAPWLSGRYASPKLVLASEGMAHLNITGIFFPYTVEANVNKINGPMLYASTMAHEAAHQRGFMAEQEANFIAFYVCTHSENAKDVYSGYALALIHALNALYRADSDAHACIYATLHEGIVRDFAANNAIWARYEGKPAEIQQTVNDVYLKTNKQEAGVASYGKMVDLLCGYYRSLGKI